MKSFKVKEVLSLFCVRNITLESTVENKWYVAKRELTLIQLMPSWEL